MAHTPSHSALLGVRFVTILACDNIYGKCGSITTFHNTLGLGLPVPMCVTAFIATTTTFFWWQLCSADLFLSKIPSGDLIVDMNWNVVEQKVAKETISELVNRLIYKHDPQGQSNASSFNTIVWENWGRGGRGGVAGVRRVRRDSSMLGSW